MIARLMSSRIRVVFASSALAALCILGAAPSAAADGSYGDDSKSCAADRPCVFASSETTNVRAGIYWNGNAYHDFYQVRWAHEGGPEHQVKINSGGDNGSFAVHRAWPDTWYYFQVQGCTSHFLAPSTCTAWGEEWVHTDP